MSEPDRFQVEIRGFTFEVEISSLGYSVFWLDCPDETHPSGYSVFQGGSEHVSRKPNAREEIIRDIEDWLETELKDRC
ncbi:MAG: hypothetical protein KH307_04695 [Varibaculum cambriense]|uniref:hypothetical protein n=1 Tax=Varibaculum cambriense TaxID=184870 RepID=UPI00241E1488|nr:hypothetical protein [Varibaculum cambriense]MBS6619589.1 hypothetical protein [Varibaculum cambriense]